MNTEDFKTLSDTELLVSSADRPELFQELVSRYQRAFVRKATAILGSTEDASDAVQESFVRIYLASRKFEEREGASFSSWAYTILVNQCRTAYTKKHKVVAISLDADPDLADTLPDQAAVREIESRFSADYVMRLVSKLPVLLRRAVEMYFIQGLTQKEIAEQEQVSNGVVRQRIHRAKKELRKMDLQFVYTRNPSASISK